VLKSLRVAGFLAFTSIKKGNFGVVALTVLILTIVSLNLLFVPSLLNGLVTSANDKLKNTYAGDIIIESATASSLIPDVEGLDNSIEGINGVTSVAPRNSLGAELSFANQRANVVVLGIVPEQEKTVFTVDKHLIEGSYLEAGDRDQILLGAQVAGADRPKLELYSRSLKEVHAGDKILAVYANGVPKTYTVKGIFYAEFIQADLQAFVSEAELETVNPQFAGKASSIRVKIDNQASETEVVSEIGKLRDGLRILTWEDYAGIVRSMTDSFNVINTILDVVNILVAAITVFIVTYIDVTNRRRQIGIQRAIGITRSSIALSYLLRGLFLAIVAAIAASLAFTYIVMPLEASHPFRFPLGNVYLVSGLPYLARAGLTLVVAALVAAFLPVWLALRIRILDAIWG